MTARSQKVVFPDCKIDDFKVDGCKIWDCKTIASAFGGLQDWLGDDCKVWTVTWLQDLASGTRILDLDCKICDCKISWLQDPKRVGFLTARLRTARLGTARQQQVHLEDCKTGWRMTTRSGLCHDCKISQVGQESWIWTARFAGKLQFCQCFDCTILNFLLREKVI